MIFFLLLTYKKNTFKIIGKSGFSAVIGGFFLSLSFVAYTFGILATSVANVVFITTDLKFERNDNPVIGSVTSSKGTVR